MVVTSGGGYPLDATFYQISKALICSMDIMKKGGALLSPVSAGRVSGTPSLAT